jgi:flavin-dependent dehydrogenase
MEVEVKVEGLLEMQARLLEIDALGAEKEVRKALRRAAKPMMERAQANAMGIGASRALAKSVKIMTRRRNAPDVVATVVVTTHAKDRTAVYIHNAAYQRQRKGIFYGWMVDQGGRLALGRGRLIRETTALTKAGFDRYERRRVRSVGERGRIRGERTWGFRRPNPWWTPAVQQTERAGNEIFIDTLRKAMARIESRRSKTPASSVIPE